MLLRLRGETTMTAWLTVDDLRAYVNNTKATGAEDASLLLSLEVGVGKVEELCGPVVETAITERVTGSGPELVLNFRAESLTAVATVAGSVLTLADYRVDGSQLLRREDDGRITGPLNVTYVAGWATAPWWAKSAALDIAAQDWRSRLSLPGQAPVPSGFLVPNKAAEKMKDHLLAPLGVA